MKNRRFLLNTGVVVAASATLTSMITSPASAETTLLDTEVGEAMEAAAPEVFEGVHPEIETSQESLTVGTDNGQSVVPTSPTEPLSVDGYGDRSVSLQLPFAEQTEEAQVLDDGTAVFDHGNGAQSIPLLKEDGSIQVTSVLMDDSAPGEYEYDFSAPGLEQITEDEDGVLTLLDAEGEYLGGVAAAWAKDAEGQDVPTRYEIEGTTVTQVIEHTGDDVTHPVTADPWLGIDLFSWTSVDDYEGDIRVNAQKSAWGQWNHTPDPGGWAVFLEFGWKELVDKQSEVTEKVTLREQYNCHVAGGYGQLADDWNLEKFRPNRTTHWSYKVAYHRCNWETADDI